MRHGWAHVAWHAGKRHVKWFNMREEPVLYINGNPYVVREASKPFANLEITGTEMQSLSRKAQLTNGWVMPWLRYLGPLGKSQIFNAGLLDSWLSITNLARCFRAQNCPFSIRTMR